MLDTGNKAPKGHQDRRSRGKAYPTMGLTIITLVFLVFVSCSSVPRQPWTATDKALFGVAVCAQGYDFYTTKRVLDHNGWIKDPWPMLYLGDDTPSTGLLAASKIAQLGLAWVVLDRVPSDYRKVILFLMTGTWVYYGNKNQW